MGTVVEEQLQTIQDNVDDAYTALGAKGATLPAANARGSANLASTVNSLPREGFPNKLWSVDANGVTTTPTGTFSVDSFDDIVAIGIGKPLSNAFKGIQVNGNITFRNLTTICSSGLYEAFRNTTKPVGVSKFSFSLPSVTSIDTSGCANLASQSSAFGSFSCSVASLTRAGEFDSAFYGSSIESISFPNLTSITTNRSGGSFYFLCYNSTALTSVSFPNLTTITTPTLYSSEGSVFCKAFYGCTSLTSLSFPELTTITGDSSSSYTAKTFSSVCENDSALLTASFPKLTTISGDGETFYTAFQECRALTSVDFSLLEKVPSGCFKYMCSNCVSLTTVKFDSLEEIGNNTFNNTFYGCTSLTTISFPSLTTVASSSFTNCFTNCTNLTSIHFPAAIQTDIEATTGYSSKWGAPNATIYFDL